MALTIVSINIEMLVIIYWLFLCFYLFEIGSDSFIWGILGFGVDSHGGFIKRSILENTLTMDQSIWLGYRKIVILKSSYVIHWKKYSER